MNIKNYRIELFDESYKETEKCIKKAQKNDTACEVRRLRDNASDAFLEVVTPTDIPALLAHIPSCHTLVTTGEKASSIAAETFGCPVPPVGSYVDIVMPGPNRASLRFWRMPSTSRAYPLPLEKKAEAYRQLF